MDFNAIIADLRASSENLPKESADRSLLSSVYCNKACKALDGIANTDNDYENVITGLWLVAAHFAEQLPYLKPVPALSELCFKLFRQCAKAVLNIQWQNLEEDSSVRQNFLVSLANLHAKLVPFDFARFRLLEALTENPWTNPTLAKVMGGEIEDDEREEVRCYIEQEDPIILQLRVDMMLKENCEEYALNLCHSCLTHPELQTDLGLRKTQLSLLYKQGQEDKLQEECQKLNIQDAVRIIKQLQTSKPHRQICTVLAQTFMVQNWIRPSDMEANKELLRLWIRHQLLVDRDQDQFKESVWAMAKLSQSTEQIVIFIDVLREECGNTYLQLYVDVCIFAINVDKGQMETSVKEGNIEAAAARRCDMSSICAKLACLCHHASVKVARMCALTSFALKPSEQSFAKIGTFYGQGGGCCSKCGLDKTIEPGIVNPATLYEVERLLNMLRPDYLSSESTYANIQILCRRFLQESLRNAQEKKQRVPQNSSGVPLLATTQVEGPGKKKVMTPVPNQSANVFEAFTVQDVQNSQLLLQKMRLQDIAGPKGPQRQPLSYPSGSSRPTILQHGQQSPVTSGQSNKVQYLFDVEKAKSKQPYGVPLEQQHQFYMQKHEKDLERRRENALKKKEVISPPQLPLNSSTQKTQNQSLLQQQPQQTQAQTQQRQMQSKQVTDIIQSALRQDSNALKRLTQGASPEVLQAVLSIMKGNTQKSTVSQSQQQPSIQQGQTATLPSQQGAQPLPTVSTLLKPSQQPQVYREQPPPRRYPRPQLYAQPIIVSTASNLPSHRQQPTSAAQSNNLNQGSQSTTAASTAVTSTQKQKVESMLVAKSHVEGIRRFMQMQMSNIQQKNISETLQMSGSTVTLNTPVSIRKPVQPSSLAIRPKTTVELAEQAALANLQKQQQAKHGFFPPQTKINLGQLDQVSPSSSVTKSNQSQFLSYVNKPSSVSQQLKQQLHLHQQQQNSSLSLNFPNNQTSAQNQNLALPSSDELSGSIMGIDESIIKELLQDSGILANTFPDIEVDSVGDDKSKRMQEPSLAPNLSTSKNSGQLYCYSTPPNVSGNKTSSLPPSTQIRNNSSIKMSHVQGSVRPLSSVSHTSGSAIVSNPSSQASSHLINSNKVQLLSNSNKLPNTLSAKQTLSSQIPSIQQLAASAKSNLSTLSRDGTSLLSKKEFKFEDKPTVDQLREMMKKEDIQGEICMDAANNATYRCIICSLAFETLDNLREHVRNVCKPGLQSSSVYNTKIKQDRANSAKAGLETTTVFQCLRCFELCVSDAGIKQHRLTCKRVPTVPSDMRKDSSNRNKMSPKLTAAKQPVVKTEYLDNSYKIPEIPLPFPHPSLNQGATLKSVSTAGSVKTQNSVTNSSISSSNKALATTSGVGSRPITVVNLNDNLVNNSSLNTKHSTQGASSSFPSKLITPISTSSSLTKSTLPVTTASVSSKSQVPITVSSFNGRSPMHATVTSKMNQPHIPVSVTSSNIVNLNYMHQANSTVPTERIGATVVDKNIIEKPKRKPKELPAPKYLEISGSGGSRFTRCKLCSQTLCSYESFLVHWQECAVKNERLLKRMLLKEKEANAKPLTGELLQSVIDVIAAVATGNTYLPENKNFDAELSDAESDLISLRDPCKSPDQETGDSEDKSGYSTNEGSEQQLESEDAENRESEEERFEDIDKIRLKKRKEKKYEDDGTEGDSYSTTGKESGDDDVAYTKRKKKYAEETEEEDNSSSGSEQGGPFVSTREAPPRLRDRKNLKPIQSFINETFVSPYSKGLSRSKSEENDVDGVEKDKSATSVSEAESDDDNLFCKVCQTPYQTKRILLQHYAGKHLQPYTVKTVADSSSYFCHLCQKTFSTFMHYMQHVPNHSVTIYEKMKAFTASRTSSQRSERIASQRGCSKKSISPKQAKALKSKKSAVDRLQHKLMSGRTQSMRERMLLSKKRRPLTRRFISSEEDYSSDASNNVIFKSKKLPENERNVDGQRIKRGRGRPRKIENYNESSGDSTASHIATNPVSRLSKTCDAKDVDSNGGTQIMAHTTRSRKRSGQKSESNVKSKRSKWGSVSESVSEEVSSENGDGEDKRKKPRETTKVIMDDFDTDSNSTTLILSQQDNGNFMPVFDIADHKNDNDEPVTDPTKPVEDCVDPQHSHRVTVRSLSKRQKERLKSCDLHPTVVLQMLALEDIDISKRSAINRTHDSVSSVDKQPYVLLDGGSIKDLDVPGNTASVKVTTSATSTNKNTSFFDSFLSYLNQYPSPSSDRGMTSQHKQSSSGQSGSVKLQKRRNSWDSRSLSSDQGGSPAIRSRSSSGEQGSVASTDPNSLADTEGSTISYCTNPDKDSHTDFNTLDHSGLSETGDQFKDPVQSLLSKFPTRRCSVNLGQKINPNDLNKAVGEQEGQESSVEKQLSSPLESQSSSLTELGHVDQTNRSLAAKTLTDFNRTVPVVALDRTELSKYLPQVQPNIISQHSETLKEENVTTRTLESTDFIDQSKRDERGLENTSNKSATEITSDNKSCNFDSFRDHSQIPLSSNLALLPESSSVSSSEKNLSETVISKANTTSVLETTNEPMDSSLLEVKKEFVESFSSSVPISDSSSVSYHNKQQNKITFLKDQVTYKPDIQLKDVAITSMEFGNQSVEYGHENLKGEAVEEKSWQPDLEKTEERVGLFLDPHGIEENDLATLAVDRGEGNLSNVINISSSLDDGVRKDGAVTTQVPDEMSEARCKEESEIGNLVTRQQDSTSETSRGELTRAEGLENKETEEIKERIAKLQSNLLETPKYQNVTTPDSMAGMSPQVETISKSSSFDLANSASQGSILNTDTAVNLQETFLGSENVSENITEFLVNVQCDQNSSEVIADSKADEEAGVEVNSLNAGTKELLPDMETRVTNTNGDLELRHPTYLPAASVCSTGEQLPEVFDTNINFISNIQVQQPVHKVDEVLKEQDSYEERGTAQLPVDHATAEKDDVLTGCDSDNQSAGMPEKADEGIYPSWERPSEDESEVNSKQRMKDLSEVSLAENEMVGIVKPVESEVEALCDRASDKETLKLTNVSHKGSERNSPVALTKNPAVSLAAFIAERLLKEDNIGKEEEVSPEATRSDAVLEEEKGGSSISSSKDATESMNVEASNESLGLVDYSSSDDDDGKAGEMTSDTNAKPGSNENVSYGDIRGEDVGTKQEGKIEQSRNSIPSSPNKVIMLSNFHYSHSVFIPSSLGNADVSEGDRDIFLEEKTNTNIENEDRKSSVNIFESKSEAKSPELKTVNAQDLEHTEKQTETNAGSLDEDDLIPGDDTDIDIIKNRCVDKEITDTVSNESKEIEDPVVDGFEMVDPFTVTDETANDEYMVDSHGTVHPSTVTGKSSNDEYVVDSYGMVSPSAVIDRTASDEYVGDSCGTVHPSSVTDKTANNEYMVDSHGMVYPSTVTDKNASDEYEKKDQPTARHADCEIKILDSESKESGIYLTGDKHLEVNMDPILESDTLEKMENESQKHVVGQEEKTQLSEQSKTIVNENFGNKEECFSEEFRMLDDTKAQTGEKNNDEELEQEDNSSENSFEDDIRLLSPDPQPDYREDIDNGEENVGPKDSETEMSCEMNVSTIETVIHDKAVSEAINKGMCPEQPVEPADASVSSEPLVSVNIAAINTEHIDSIDPEILTEIEGSTVVEESCTANESEADELLKVEGPVENSSETQEVYKELNLVSTMVQESEKITVESVSLVTDMPENAEPLLTEAKQQDDLKASCFESEGSAKEKDADESHENLSKKEKGLIYESVQVKESALTLLTENAQAFDTELKEPDNENTSTNLGTAEDEKSKNEEKLTETYDDGDDLSDFDLVIEKDTSSRNVVSLHSTYEKKRASATPQSASSIYATQTEQVSTSTGLKNVKTASKAYKKIPVLVEKPAAQTINSGYSRRKPLGGAKSLRKNSQEQFVWDDDDEEQAGQKKGERTFVTQPVPVLVAEVQKTVPVVSEKKILLRLEKNVTGPRVQKKSTSPVTVKNQVTSMERKRKALRDMTETAPFTWDLEESPDKPSQSQSSDDTTNSRRSVRNTALPPEAKKEKLTVKPAERILQKKRPLTPDVGPPRKRPAKVKRARSMEKQLNLPVAMIEQPPTEDVTVNEKEAGTTLRRESASNTKVIENIQNSITIDEEISFKTNSFSSPLTSYEATSSPAGQDSPSSSLGDNEIKSGRRRPRRNPLSSTASKNEGRKDISSLVSSDHSEEVLLKNQPLLRSRHSSMDSNLSDKSMSSKRSTNSSPQTGVKRGRRSEDKLTPKLKKAGLIKITKNSNSPTAQSSGSDSIAPMTRSSEAAKKAFNQKSLRNRGVNPPDTVLSSSSPTSKYSTIGPGPKLSPLSPLTKTLPVNSHFKINSEMSPKIKSQVHNVQKMSSPSSKHLAGSLSILSHPSEESSRVSKKVTESYDSHSTAAVVKRRSPTGPVPLRRPGGNKTSGRRSSRPHTAKTTVYLVDPVPSTPASRGSSKSHAGTPIKTTTVHTTIPPGSAPMKTKKPDNGKKQSKWKINKETKLATSRKRQKGPISFKRA